MRPKFFAILQSRFLGSCTIGLAGLCMSLVAAATTSAALTYIGQDREVSTFATIDFIQGEDQFSNDMFETLEDGQFEGAADCLVGVPGDQAHSTGHQLSYLLPDLILAEGAMSGQAEISEAATFAEGFGMSRFVSLFSVDVPTEVHVQLTLFAGGNGAANFVFRIANGTIFIHRSIHDGSDDVDETLTLQPGQYEVTAVTSGYGQALPNGGGEPASGSFSLSMIFPSATAAPILGARRTRSRPSWRRTPCAARRGFCRRQVHGVAGSLGAAHSGSEITIFDLSGRIVRRFANVDAGGVTWDARDLGGHPVAAGIYLVRASNGATTRALVLR